MADKQEPKHAQDSTEPRGSKGKRSRPLPEPQAAEPATDGRLRSATPPGDRPLWHIVGGWLGLIGALVCLGFVGYHLMNGRPWDRTDTILTIGAGLLTVVALMVWWEPVTHAVTARGTLFQANALIMVVLLFGILFVLNKYIVERHLGSQKLDLTAEKFYSLSDQTKSILKSIDKENAIELIVLRGSDLYAMDQTWPIKQQRLESYGEISPYVDVKVWDPNTNPKGGEFYQQGLVSSIGGAVVVRKKDHPEQAEGVNSLEEAEVTRGILKVLDPQERKVYFTTGHGEPSLQASDTTGLSVLVRILGDMQYQTEALSLATTETVPSDAAAVAIIGPRTGFSEAEVQRLQAYLADGGRLLALLDPVRDVNLNNLLTDYGLEMHDAEVHDPEWTLPGGDDRQFGTDPNITATHEIVDTFKSSPMQFGFRTAGYLTQVAGASGYQVTELLKTSATSYATPVQASTGPRGALDAAAAAANEAATAADETDDAAAAEAEPAATPATEAERTEGPFTLAAVSIEPEPAEGTEDKDKDTSAEDFRDDRTRVAVISDGDFLLNLWAMNYGPTNFYFGVGMIAWLTENTKVIGAPPKDPAQDLEKRKFTVDAKTARWLLVLTLILPLLAVASAYAAVKLARRVRL